MKTGFKVGIFLLLLFSAAQSYAIRVGDPAPQFTLQDTAGVDYSLNDYEGSVVFLTFFGFS